ncbi:Zonadhesin [Trichoplax sp. H2]|nr:Zonadhesin [Trichoplax sp. H2]|eukprot:RDD44155.1 Zonadhesin [Trichoplax sp. H2]
MSTTDSSSVVETAEPIATSEWNSNISTEATSEAELTPTAEGKSLATEPYTIHPETESTPEVETANTLHAEVTPEGEAVSTPYVETEVTPEAELGLTPLAEVESTPEGETSATPFAETEATPEAEVAIISVPEGEVTPELETVVTPNNETETTAEAESATNSFPEGEATPESEAVGTPYAEIETTPEAESAITSFPEGEVTPESEIGVTPYAELESTPEAETAITPFPEVETTPESEIGITPYPEMETTPEAETEITPFPEIETTPESELGITPYPEMETTPEAESAMTAFPEVETTPESELSATPYPEMEMTPESESMSTPYPEFENHPNAETAVTPYAEFEFTPEAELSTTPEEESPLLPESEVTSAPEVELSSFGETSPETEVEVIVSGEPETAVSLAEPTPAWTEAIPQWGAAWPIHIYFFGAIFILIALFALYSLVKPRKRKFKVIGMLFNRLVLFFLFVFATTRAICLLVDPYHSKGIMPPLLYNIIWALGSPCLISSLGVYMILLLDANYAVKTLRLAKLNNFLIVCTIYFLLVFAAEFMAYFTSANSMASRIVTFICQAFYFLWGAFCNIGFIIAAVMLHQRAILTAIALAESRRFIAKNFAKSNKMSKLFTLSVSCSIIGLALSAIHFYAMVTLFNMFVPHLRVYPWPWWAFQTSYRMIEVIAAFILCKVATVASAVKRYSHIHREGFIASICIKLMTCCGSSNRTDSEISAVTDMDNPSFTKGQLTLVHLD